MIIDLCFTTFCNFFTQDLRQEILCLFSPATYSFSPLLYTSFLLRSKLAFFFEVADCFLSI